MVQQTKDSTFTEYRLSHAESGVSNTDKQQSPAVDAKKSTLHDSHVENPMTVSKSIESPLLAEECSKIPISQSLPSHLKSNAGGGHIVYVRRKTETESAKTSGCDTRSDATGCPRLAKPENLDETAQEHAKTNELTNACHIRTDTVESPHFAKTTNGGGTARHQAEGNGTAVCISDAAPLHRIASSSFSSTKSLASPLVMTNNISSSENVNNVHVDCTHPSSNDPITVNFKLWEERYSHLQDLLRMLDQAGQDDYVQMLRSLPSVELSRHAVELEKRSMKLQLEEAQELQRVRFFDILGKYPNNIGMASAQQENLQRK